MWKIQKDDTCGQEGFRSKSRSFEEAFFSLKLGQVNELVETTPLIGYK